VTVRRKSGDIEADDPLCGAGRGQARELVVGMLTFHGHHHTAGRTQMAGDADESREIGEGTGNDHCIPPGRPVRFGAGTYDRNVSKPQLYDYLFDKTGFFIDAVEHRHGTLPLDHCHR